MKQILKVLFSRLFIVGLLILIQAIILGIGIWKLTNYFVYMYILFTIISIAVVIYILNKKDNPSYKLAWTIPILLFPIFGGLFYLVFGGDKTSKAFKKSVKRTYEDTKGFLIQNEELIKQLQEKDKNIAKQVKYIYNYSSFPMYKNTKAQYLSPGENFFNVLKDELKKAKYFIFMEYFIIEEGVMWDSILDILVEKVNEGVEVRVLYDDAGCIQTLPYKYHEKLQSLGIQVIVFNEIQPKLSLKMNNRDHKKITVIDGVVGFTGGANLADEYINAVVKHGQWKDASILLKGDAVTSLTLMFLQSWNFDRLEKNREDYKRYLVRIPDKFNNEGYVQPYADSPLDEETVGENVYINMINQAKEYVYINTPYLIIDNELMTALTLAAKSGIDIRIVTPHIADKWYVHLLTRAYYQQLIEAGVKIYEYTPGFIHSKTFVVDDEIGVVGTINLDFRSLYLHFECGVFMYKTLAIGEIKQDFLETLEVCLPITLEECHNVKWYTRLMRSVIRCFAPLM
ncbi:cardiolipin synthase [Niameybacter massiliensis]|uniref:Cardiolipin synthase n=1 Tax=Holtiella tumoricola TaxID=3018743 RepID=A0AA42DLL4_9FIRM|nr:cardiolipin synthase [Holtiella tumoricola]MDA3730918.1 cardiolipin synthase [Holtiella tumoricola]